MNPHLDAGLVACALIAIVALAGLVLWLIGAGHLDQIERTPMTLDERADRAALAHEWGAKNAPARHLPSSQRAVARGDHPSRAASSTTRSTATPGAGEVHHPSGQVAPAQERRDPRRDR